MKTTLLCGLFITFWMPACSFRKKDELSGKAYMNRGEQYIDISPAESGKFKELYSRTEPSLIPMKPWPPGLISVYPMPEYAGFSSFDRNGKLEMLFDITAQGDIVGRPWVHQAQSNRAEILALIKSVTEKSRSTSG